MKSNEPILDDKESSNLKIIKLRRTKIHEYTMDKTTFLNATTFKRNDTDKSNERELCDGIHNNLRTLAFFYPFNDEFKAIFEHGMFIRPNQKAFANVIRYLLMIFDPNEFKKKFCWPLYNKAAESTFRYFILYIFLLLHEGFFISFFFFIFTIEKLKKIT